MASYALARHWERERGRKNSGQQQHFGEWCRVPTSPFSPSHFPKVVGILSNAGTLRHDLSIWRTPYYCYLKNFILRHENKKLFNRLKNSRRSFDFFSNIIDKRSIGKKKLKVINRTIKVFDLFEQKIRTECSPKWPVLDDTRENYLTKCYDVCSCWILFLRRRLAGDLTIIYEKRNLRLIVDTAGMRQKPQTSQQQKLEKSSFSKRSVRIMWEEEEEEAEADDDALIRR